tara:strand:+ start:415 stop:804 length:390 start_codon:yes stop_codon:yes gene_type:complete
MTKAKKISLFILCIISLFGCGEQEINYLEEGYQVLSCNSIENIEVQTKEGDINIDKYYELVKVKKEESLIIVKCFQESNCTNYVIPNFLKKEELYVECHISFNKTLDTSTINRFEPMPLLMYNTTIIDL